MLTKEEFKSLFVKQTKELNLEEFNRDELIFKLKDIQDDILEKNKFMNITSIKDDERFLSLHWIDGLTVMKSLKSGFKVIDIGTGGGMVPIVIALANPEIKVVALDSSNKRINYLSEIKTKYGISNLKPVAARSEDYIRNEKGQREAYDVVLARAVAHLRPLCELCVPYVKNGGVFIAMKGPGVKEELETSENAIKTLGCEVENDEVFEICCSGEKIEHHNLILRKIHKTDILYPRNYSQISKNPL